MTRSAPAHPPAGWSPAAAPPLHGPWPSVSLWARRWTGPSRPATAAAAGAVVAAGLVSALSIPLDRPGVGWLVAVIAGIAALIIARRMPDRSTAGVPAPLVRRPGTGRSPARYGWAAATVALLAVGTVRAAGWLFVLCLFTAAITAALAVAGGRSTRGMLLATGMAPIAVFRSVPWLSQGLARMRRTGRDGVGGVRIVATIGVSLGLLLVFGALFASADDRFADLLGRAVPDVDAGTVTRWIFVGIVATGVLSGAAFLRAAPPDLSGLDAPGTRRVGRVEWAVPLTTLVLLFAAFVAVQIPVLFGGGQHVRDTDDLTVAAYARGGFWQLLVVTGLTLVVLAVAARWAPRDTPTDRTLIRVLLGALAVLTLLIVASALQRMDVYAGSFGLTRLRLLVAACELWLGAVFVMILLAGIRLRAAWLPQAVVAAGVLALLGLAVANPDRLIAERNVTRSVQGGDLDFWYVSNLSADAVPALDRLDGATRACVLRQIGADLESRPDDWRGWNLGRARARESLADRPAADWSEPCTADLRD